MNRELTKQLVEVPARGGLTARGKHFENLLCFSRERMRAITLMNA
jgi:hypothetical protein